MLGEEEIPVGWGGQQSVSLLQTVVAIPFLPSEAHALLVPHSPLSHFLAQLKLIFHEDRVKVFFHILLGLYFNLLYKHGNPFHASMETTAIPHSCKTLC